MLKMTSKPKTLVVHKRSLLEEMRANNDDVDQLLAQGDESVSKLVPSHERHRKSLDTVCNVLDGLGWPMDVRYRGDVESVEGYELILTVGGDGTVLDVSHKLTNGTPLLGVNSDPVSSVGYFCATTAKGIEDALTGVLTGEVTALALSRFQISINGQVIGLPVLNDILITDRNAAATSKYILKVSSHVEAHRSSGIWVSTPAGSTAAIRSAGGIVLPLGSRLLQYMVREPCLPPRGRYNLLGGVQPIEAGLSLVSRMQTGGVFLDGPHASFDLNFGDRVEVLDTASPLVLLGVNEEKRFA